MAAITEDYVSFETAKLLKEKWFDESVNRFYAINTDTHSLVRTEYCRNSFTTSYAAPTLQMAMKWLREVHNLFIQITVDFSDGAYPMYDVCVVNLAICNSIIINGYDKYSYKEAVEAAIKYCLKNLI